MTSSSNTPPFSPRARRATAVVALAGTALGVGLLVGPDLLARDEGPQDLAVSTSATTSPSPIATLQNPSPRSESPAPPPQDLDETDDAVSELPVLAGLEPPREVVEAGLLDESLLEPSGSVTVTEDGAVVENLDVSGNIKVKADDVTIRNVRVRTTTNAYGIDVTKGRHGTTIEHVEVEVGVDGTSANAAIGGNGDDAGLAGTQPGDNVTVRRSFLHGSGDGIKAANYSLYEENRIEMARGEGSVKHIDGIQASGSSEWTARRNLILEPYSSGHNSAIFAQPYTGKRDTAIGGIRIENNWVNGGVYSIQLGDAKSGESGLVSGVVIDRNVFYGDFKYGALLTRGADEVTGNGGVWAATGETVPTGEVRGG